MERLRLRMPGRGNRNTCCCPNPRPGAPTAATGVTCNAASPDTLPTPAIYARIDALAAARGLSPEDATRDYMKERQPSGRFVEFADVGATIVFCAARRPATSPER
jgi:NAD(P)-dependent dehydrogenase (short-subunit alcohol dehydrogenase family)